MTPVSLSLSKSLIVTFMVFMVGNPGMLNNDTFFFQRMVVLFWLMVDFIFGVSKGG